ncbi:hypothetical protein FB468_0822 [Leucobacter komagatae]|uniref:Lipoprotein n=1 Tax=Leucobacter komagatae TaxID=55969 RepID=A0A542Y418_9MICO|nr:hypothetical protein [Leucobacter komagatae]TQL42814.1 hypothetical protein FB468_0822 [Leucobacter komagatae]
MHGRLLTTAALALATAAASLTLAGCASAQTGTATIELRQLPEDLAGEQVQVRVSVDGEAFEALELGEGTTMAFEGVPFGEVEIEAGKVCSVAGSIDEPNPTIRLIVEGANCTLAD